MHRPGSGEPATRSRSFTGWVLHMHPAGRSITMTGIDEPPRGTLISINQLG
jgi:hypothetical protein